MNKLTNFKNNTKSKSIPIGIALGFALMLMIPIVNTGFAKPKFDGTTLGIACSDLWDEIQKLKDKKADQGGELSQEDASALGRAESNYKDICEKYYGTAPTVKNPNVQNPAIRDDLVVKQPDESDSEFPRDIINDQDMVKSQPEEQPDESDSSFSEGVIKQK